MILPKNNIIGFFIISVSIIIGLYNLSINNGLLPITNPLVAYTTTATTTTANTSHSEHMAGMHHNPPNSTMSEEDKKRFCGNASLNSNFYVNEFVIPVQCSQPVGLAVDKDNNIWIASETRKFISL